MIRTARDGSLAAGSGKAELIRGLVSAEVCGSGR
jgi:hypothetical protein